MAENKSNELMNKENVVNERRHPWSCISLSLPSIPRIFLLPRLGKWMVGEKPDRVTTIQDATPHGQASSVKACDQNKDLKSTKVSNGGPSGVGRTGTDFLICGPDTPRFRTSENGKQERQVAEASKWSGPKCAASLSEAIYPQANESAFLKIMFVSWLNNSGRLQHPISEFSFHVDQPRALLPSRLRFHPSPTRYQ